MSSTATAKNDSKPHVEEHDFSHGIKDVQAYERQWVAFFEQAPDLFELQRGLNNCFSYDIVPTVPILLSAIRSCRRLNDFPTAVRIFDGLRDKVENPEQYQLYIRAMEDVRAELGIPTPEELKV